EVMAIAAATTDPVTWISSSRGVPAGASATKARTAAAANATPTRAPAAARRALSVRSCATMRLRAARRPDRDLTRTPAATHDEQVGNIDAGDQQKQPGGRCEGEHRGSDIAD